MEIDKFKQVATFCFPEAASWSILMLLHGGKRFLVREQLFRIIAQLKDTLKPLPREANITYFGNFARELKCKNNRKCVWSSKLCD
jgi:hypothetical protein